MAKMFWGHFNNLLQVVMVSHCVVPNHHLFRHFWDLSWHYFSCDDVFFQRVNLEHNIIDHPINCTSLLCHNFSFLPERAFHQTSPNHNTTILSLQKTKKMYKFDIYKLYSTTHTKTTKKIYKFNITTQSQQHTKFFKQIVHHNPINIQNHSDKLYNCKRIASKLYVPIR